MATGSSTPLEEETHDEGAAAAPATSVSGSDNPRPPPPSLPQSNDLENEAVADTQDNGYTSTVIMDKSRVSSYHLGIAKEVSPP